MAESLPQIANGKSMQTIEKTTSIFSDDDFEVFEFNDQIHPRIKIRPMYFKLGFSSSDCVFGRRAVANRLIKALELVPSEYGFLIWDVYRPRHVQEKLFNWMQEEIRKKFPQLNDQKNYEEANKYMSSPSKIGDSYCPPIRSRKNMLWL